MKMHLTFSILLALYGQFLQAQSLTQVIRGKVLDNETRMTIALAKIQILTLQEKPQVLTDSLGEFVFTSVPVGRHMIRISADGYAEQVLSDIILNSAKQVVLQVELAASVIQLNQAEVKVKRNDPAGTHNDLALISGRKFTIDQTNRYAGSLGDPSRMAANFAGVSSVGSQRNDIIIRGNSPMGLLWRLEGADIPNPNHYASQGATGGPVSILNNNTLANSDFLTGAFPAEYGNAGSGVFDLKLRSGNNRKHEFLGQVGFNGFEAGAEGPLRKKNGGSYLVNYRYSTLALMSKLGFKLTYGGVPLYQDLTFKINLPKTKTGEWALMGIGGKSAIEILDKNRDTTDMSYGNSYRNNILNGSDMGVVILNNVKRLGKTGYLRNTISVSYQKRFTRVDSVRDDGVLHGWKYAEDAINTRFQWHGMANVRLSNRLSMRSGAMINRLGSHLRDSFKNGEVVRALRDFEGNSMLLQVYHQWKWQLANRWLLTPGVYTQYWTQNGKWAAEPRLGARYTLSRRSSLQAGAGIHHTLQPLEIMYTRIWDTLQNKYREPNTKLGYSRAKHAVVGFEWLPFSALRIKTEFYYQYLDKVPVDIRTKNNLSLLNWGADFGGLPAVDSFVNQGKGRNYGVEITIEKFFSKGYYWLLTTSLFDSRYAMSDGVWKNTAWNGHYVINALAGYDWKPGKNKNNIVSFNLKFTSAGGRRYIPVDVAETMKSSTQVVYDMAHAFEKQFADYFRADLRIGFKRNGKRITQEWAVDLQNVTNRMNPLTMGWDYRQKTVRTEYQQGFFPMMQYRLYF
ncbi:MAG: TonB-dependent receptor [Bacteroidetes bacterium]|nr:TonB-dependent receptor [Bacteroidota bacterium]